MGNRAVITIKNKHIPKDDWTSLYLHWNGGRDSVVPFLKVAKLYGIRCNADPSYGIARLCQLIGNTFGGTLSLGVGKYTTYHKESLDNGVYIIDNWEIVDREFFEGEEQNEYDEEDFIKEIRAVNDKIFGHEEDNVTEIHVFK
tara:strand:- start:349 stop:777 length:429 start_codon:yes stop_codon:yes gene_type:complete